MAAFGGRRNSGRGVPDVHSAFRPPEAHDAGSWLTCPLALMLSSSLKKPG